MKTSELSGIALDWAVGKCEGLLLGEDEVGEFRYSSDWAQGGPIIEREDISIQSPDEVCPSLWAAKHGELFSFGSTPLIAAMRCYAASRFGNKIEIPKELL